MRINFAATHKKGSLSSAFINESVKAFKEEYDFRDARQCWAYIFTGKQGLETFAEFMRSKGWTLKAYHLPPNKDPLMDVGDDWNKVSRTSPSFGVVLDESDPKWVEFKLRHG